MEVDIGEDEVIGVPKAPNKDTNTYSDSDDDGLEIGRHGDGSEAAADIFSYFFWRNFMVKQVALVELGTWVLMFLITVGAVSLDLVCFYFCHYFRYV